MQFPSKGEATGRHWSIPDSDKIETILPSRGLYPSKDYIDFSPQIPYPFLHAPSVVSSDNNIINIDFQCGDMGDSPRLQNTIH